MEIIVKNQALNQWLENVALAWRAKFPERAAMYADLLRVRLESLASPTGMSPDGNIQYKAEVPQELYWVINQRIPDFFRSPANVRKFQEYFMGDLAPKHSPTKKTIVIEKE